MEPRSGSSHPVTRRGGAHTWSSHLDRGGTHANAHAHRHTHKKMHTHREAVALAVALTVALAVAGLPTPPPTRFYSGRGCYGWWCTGWARIQADPRGRIRIQVDPGDGSGSRQNPWMGQDPFRSRGHIRIQLDPVDGSGSIYIQGMGQDPVRSRGWAGIKVEMKVQLQ